MNSSKKEYIGVCFAKFAKDNLIDASKKEDAIDSDIKNYRARLEKSLQVIFEVDCIKFYSSKDGLDIYWPLQEEEIYNQARKLVKRKKKNEKNLVEIKKHLAAEKRILEREKLKRRKDKLKRELVQIQKNITKLCSWDEIPFEKVMNIVDKDTIFSPMEHIEPTTASLYAFIIKLSAFDYVENAKDPCEVLGQISPNNRKELAKKIISAYYKDKYFKKYVDYVIKRKKLVSFLPEVESFIGLNCKDNDLNLVLYPIMCPYKYMLLRSGYLILRAEGEYSDEDAHNMLTNNREPYANLPEAVNWKKKENQLSWINKFITARMDSSVEKKYSNYDELNDMPEDYKQYFNGC